MRIRVRILPWNDHKFQVKRLYRFLQETARRLNKAIGAPSFRPDITASLIKSISQLEQGSKGCLA